MGGLTGAAVYLLSYNVFPVFQAALPTSVCLGASAAVTAYIVLIAVLQPDYRVLFFGILPVTFKWIALAYVVFDVFQLTGGNAGGHFAHLGGALFGLLFAVNLKKGKDITVGFNNLIDKIVSLFSFSSTRRRQPEMKVSYQNTKDVREMTDAEFNQNKAEDQKRTDEILEKISKSGYDNLTKEEKAFLFRMSRK